MNTKGIPLPRIRDNPIGTKHKKMIETKETEAMVQDQNLPAPQNGAEQKENHVTMESQEQIPGVQTLGAAVEGESQAAEVPATETPAVETEAEPTPKSPFLASASSAWLSARRLKHS